jgi:hypothetical protein
MKKKKIALATAAARRFVTNFIRPGVDRAMIASFGSAGRSPLRIEQDFTDDKARLDAALDAVERSVGNEGTRLYDGTADATDVIRIAARPKAVRILIIKTDGEDEGSVQFRDSIVRGRRLSAEAVLGLHLRHNFLSDPRNYAVLIGVGSGRQINEQALATIGEYGGFPAVAIDSFSMLEGLYKSIAEQVTAQFYGGGVYQAGGRTWAQIAEVRKRVAVPIDVMFLIDRSGSMGLEETAPDEPASRFRFGRFSDN